MGMFMMQNLQALLQCMARARPPHALPILQRIEARCVEMSHVITLDEGVHLVNGIRRYVLAHSLTIVFVALFFNK
jgi:hypothetical protein